jgi:copper ion binding protein
MTTTVTYPVEGMTCEHCVRAVTTELGGIPGVQHVSVDLATGTAEVVSDAPLPFAAVQAAVDEAGYEVRSIA